MPETFIPRKTIDVAKLFNGLQVETRFETKQGGIASVEREAPDAFEADLTLTVKVPAPARKPEEVAADKGYHKAATLELATALNLQTYIPEPKRKHRSRWTDKPEEHRAVGQRKARGVVER